MKIELCIFKGRIEQAAVRLHHRKNTCYENSSVEAAMNNERSAMLILDDRVPSQPQMYRVIPAIPRWRFTVVSLCATCVFLVGLAVRGQESRPVSGFLGDYSKLVPDAKNGDLLLYEKDRDAMKKYNKFIFDPITIYLLPEARDRGIVTETVSRPEGRSTSH
jgi:hypothetical protein